ncbi:MAG: HAMP domain-containing protein [Pseudonocardiaceae bacterium]|nr:HAMP domain-containing protein [Pseudonocardiaceae bacterium]
MTLRLRLGLLTASAVALVVVIGSALGYAMTRSALMSQVDIQLQERIAPQALRVEVAGTPPPGPNLLAAVPVSVQLVGPEGVIGPAQTPVSLPVGADERALLAGRGEQTLRTVEVAGARYRMLSVPAPDGLVVQVARPLADVDATLGRLAWGLGLVGLGGVGAAALLGTAVSCAGLRPVDWVTAATERVAATSSLDRRIPVHGRDEVARLARSVNGMLDALAHAREQQRSLVEDASHELRTPLTALRTNIGLLLRAERAADRDLDPADRAALLADLEAEAEALSRLVSELVDLARGDAEPEQPTTVGLRAVVDAAVARTRLVRPDVTVDVAGDGGRLAARPATLERAVANLVRNAVQASPAGGRVRVRLDRDDGAARVTVTDSGPGVPVEERDRVFDRFYRSPSSRHGTGSGLGLAIVTQAAALHGGSVTVADADGGGGEFVLTVPLSPDP